MTKQQRMVERRMYLHDVHSRQGDSGWHRIEPIPAATFYLATVVGMAAVVVIAVLTRL